MNSIRLLKLHSKIVLIGLLSCSTTSFGMDFTGRFSMLANTAQASEGQIGYINKDQNTLSADQQSLRLMLDNHSEQTEWSVHLRMRRQQLTGFSNTASHYTDLFRYQPLSEDWISQQTSTSSLKAGYEIDRAVYQYHFKQSVISAGRQPIDWGVGRLWQPMNVFGAFAPTDLDTDFKPGIDSVTYDWYPTAFSNLTAAFVLTNKDQKRIDTQNSFAIHYRNQIGDASELLLLASQVIGNQVYGGAIETAWQGIGVRLEAVYAHLTEHNKDTFFWVGGLDYQLNDKTTVLFEVYDNSHGATSYQELTAMQTDPLVVFGLQPQLSRHMIGVGITHEITPLWQTSYTLLGSLLTDSMSFLHQLNLTYSVSNESDLLISAMVANGATMNSSGDIQSEFGATPNSVTARLRFYF
uniref:Uncharacterized protein n=1 Tax=Hydrogenovibrio crunogenus (strain DSM 25203 / XCL-2) TaxID=317025 RepID=Q31IJ5_HYDCU